MADGTRPRPQAPARPRTADAPASSRPAENRSTAGSLIASSARSPASGPPISPSTSRRGHRRPERRRHRNRRGAASAARSGLLCPALALVQWADWIAASYWKRPGLRRSWASRSSASPRSISTWSHSLVSCSPSGMKPPSAVRLAGLRASDRHTSAARPSTSGSSGSSSASTSARCSASAASDSIGSPRGASCQSIA